MKQLIIIVLTFFFFIEAEAQGILPNELISKKGYSTFLGGLEISTVPYINTLTQDSSSFKIYLAPYLSYWHKSGLGVEVKSRFLPSGENAGLYLTQISSMYSKFEGSILPYFSYTRYLFSNNASIPYTPIKNEVYAHLKFKPRLLDITLAADWGFGKDEENNNSMAHDFNVLGEVSRIFRTELAKKRSTIFIIPALRLNAATDRYFKFLRTSKYISQNRTVNGLKYGKSSRGNQARGNVENELLISETNNFTFSNVEANISLIYLIGKFSVEPSGSLFIPLRDEKLNAYWQLNLNYFFK